MFIKSKLSFKNAMVFDKRFKPRLDHCFCVVSRMLFNNRINVDGSIDMENAGFLTKYELWSYIYYLYYYNNSSIDEFVAMKNKDNSKASAMLFYQSVKKVIQNQYVADDEVVAFDVNSLVYFINMTVHKYGTDLRNPVIDYLRRILGSKDAVAKLSNFTLVTGRPETNVQVVTKPENVKNANIKVRLGYSDA